jgi:hypothetical protein
MEPESDIAKRNGYDGHIEGRCRLKEKNLKDSLKLAK